MFDSKGKKFCVFLLLVAVLLTYAASVDAKGRRGSGRSFGRVFSRSHSWHSSHSGRNHRARTYVHSTHSSSTRSNPSLLLIALLLISIASLNAPRTLNSEVAGALFRRESRVHKLQFRNPISQAAN